MKKINNVSYTLIFQLIKNSFFNSAPGYNIRHSQNFKLVRNIGILCRLDPKDLILYDIINRVDPCGRLRCKFIESKINSGLIRGGQVLMVNKQTKIFKIVRGSVG